MVPEVVLCLDSESARHPELVGLDGENLWSQDWLEVVCSADAARERLRSLPSECEAWVAASDDMDPLNLAAALKKDTGSRRVLLVAFGAGGSLRSRASAAQVDLEPSYRGFARCYARMKAHCALADSAGAARREAAQREASRSEGDKRLPRAAHASGPIPCAGKGEAHSVMISESEGPCEPRAEQQAVSAVARATSADSVGSCEEQKPVVFEVARRVAGSSDARGQDPRALRDGLGSKRALLITVAGASGGAGKSTVAVLAAFIAQGLGLSTLLVDADMQFGDMHHLSGIESPVTLREVVEEAIAVESLRAEGGTPALLAAPPRLEQSETLADALPGVIERACAAFDVVVANTGAFWGELHAQLIERSDHVLFVIDQRSSALRAARRALELCFRCGIATSPFLFAVNRCTKGSLISSVDAACALGGARAVELDEGGFEVDELLGAGLPFELLGSRNALCESLAEVLAELLPRTQAASEPRRQARRPRFGRRRGRAACL